MNYGLIVVLVIVVILVLWIISVSNSLNKSIVKIDEANSGIDVALTKRYDTLTKMIDVVKSYAKHEKETIFEVINLRQNMTTNEKVEANNKINSNLEKIYALAENYPELKSSENYNTLQKSIADAEEHLQAARRMFNSNVSIYNQKLVSFPSSLIANMKGLTKKDFFEAEEIKKEDIKIDL